MDARLPATRLYVEHELVPGMSFELSSDQAHQLRHVQRLGDGAMIALFNGRHGEFFASLKFTRREAEVKILAKRREQNKSSDLWLLFAPIKHGRIDFLVEKASELGVSQLHPVITRRTQIARVNCTRLRQTAREAAEQCERLTVPAVHEPVKLEACFAAWDMERALFVGAETGDAQPLAAAAQKPASAKAAILIGPEGGFAPEELSLLRGQHFVIPVGLGPRLLRAETAAIAALSIWQAIAGEWDDPASRPHADIL